MTAGGRRGLLFTVFGAGGGFAIRSSSSSSSNIKRRSSAAFGGFGFESNLTVSVKPTDRPNGSVDVSPSSVKSPS